MLNLYVTNISWDPVIWVFHCDKFHKSSVMESLYAVSNSTVLESCPRIVHQVYNLILNRT
jgi:hypothetical protein